MYTVGKNFYHRRARSRELKKFNLCVREKRTDAGTFDRGENRKFFPSGSSLRCQSTPYFLDVRFTNGARPWPDLLLIAELALSIIERTKRIFWGVSDLHKVEGCLVDITGSFPGLKGGYLSTIFCSFLSELL
jgi:hypothetical protein